MTKLLRPFLLQPLICVPLLVATGGCTAPANDPIFMPNTPIVVQPSLGGRLTDAVTGAPVVGATLTLQGKSVTSSPTGHYGFDPNLTAGTYPLTIRHEKYIDITQDVEVAPYKLLDFKMQPK